MEGSVKCLEESVKKIKIRKLLSKLCQDLFFWWGKLVTNPFEFFFLKKKGYFPSGCFLLLLFYFLMMLLWFVLEIFIHFNLCSFKPILWWGFYLWGSSRVILGYSFSSIDKGTICSWVYLQDPFCDDCLLAYWLWQPLQID